MKPEQSSSPRCHVAELVIAEARGYGDVMSLLYWPVVASLEVAVVTVVTPSHAQFFLCQLLLLGVIVVVY